VACLLFESPQIRPFSSPQTAVVDSEAISASSVPALPLTGLFAACSLAEAVVQPKIALAVHPAEVVVAILAVVEVVSKTSCPRIMLNRWMSWSARLVAGLWQLAAIFRSQQNHPPAAN
jgi:hypothetical protein